MNFVCAVSKLCFNCIRQKSSRLPLDTLGSLRAQTVVCGAWVALALSTHSATYALHTTVEAPKLAYYINVSSLDRGQLLRLNAVFCENRRTTSERSDSHTPPCGVPSYLWCKCHVTYTHHLLQRWRNEFVKWDPDDFGGIQKINMEPSEVWTPRVEPITRLAHTILKLSREL